MLKFPILIALFFAVIDAQTNILPINSFSNGGPSSLNVNSLGLDQGVDTVSSYYMDNERLHIVTLPNQPALFWTTLSAAPQCLPIPPANTIETTVSFRIQLPAGMDMSIVLQTGTDGGCQGQRNDSASVRLSNYQSLDGEVSWVNIPLIAFDPTLSNYLNGRLTALLFQFQPFPSAADILFDEVQLVSRPRLMPLSASPAYVAQLASGPPQGQWLPPSSNGRCGPQFGWASCQQGQCCSSAGWCGSTPMHCLSSQSLLSFMPSSMVTSQQQFSQQVASHGLVWGPPLSSSRCGRDFNWAGCQPGEACSMAGYCGTSPQHFATAQTLNQGQQRYTGAAPLIWSQSRMDNRCGRDFNWAGCDSGCCSQTGFCSTSDAACRDSQELGR